MRIQHQARLSFGGLCAAFLLIAATAIAAPSAKKFDEGMQRILPAYLTIQEKLAADSTAGVAAEARSIAAAAKTLDTGELSGAHAAELNKVPDRLKGAAQEVAEATTIDAVREAFKDLSEPMATWAGTAHPSGVDVMFCPMADARWLQRQGETRNPYYGAEMASCGEVVNTVGDAAPGMMHH